VLAILIGLATPFGSFVKESVMNVTKSLGDKVLSNLDIDITDRPGGNSGGGNSGESGGSDPSVPDDPGDPGDPGDPSDPGDNNDNEDPEPSDPGFGEPVTGWDISETNAYDVRMTFCRTAEEEENEDKSYSGTVHITGTGRMHAQVYCYLLDIDVYVGQILEYYKEKNGYNYRAEYDTTTDNFMIAFSSLKIYVDDESAGAQNGSELDWETGGFGVNLADDSLKKYNPKVLIVDEGVTNISDRAFYGMRMHTVKLPSTLKEIGAGAFMYDFSLQNIELPEGLETIGEGAFKYCTFVNNITIPESVTYIAADAFDTSAIIRGAAGSYAETWANANGYTFKAI
jgi:hypothetical protein